MSRKDDLEQLTDLPTGSARREDLERAAKSTGCSDVDGFIDATSKICSLRWDGGERRVEGWLELHSDKWSVDLSVPGNREGLQRVVLSAMLVRAGWVDATITWVARVLPAMIDLDATSAEIENGRILVRLRFVPGELPEYLQDSVNALDFAEAVGLLAEAAGSRTETRVTDSVTLVVEPA